MCRIRDALGRTDIVLLSALSVIAAASCTFLSLDDAVTDGPSGHVDTSLLWMLREPDDPSDPIGPKWLEEAVRDVTSLGSYAILTLLVASVLGDLLMVRHPPPRCLCSFRRSAGRFSAAFSRFSTGGRGPPWSPHLVRVSIASAP